MSQKTTGKYAKATLTIRGTRPLLFNKFTADILSGERKEKSGSPGNAPEEWKKSVSFVGRKRQLYVDPSYIFGCLKNGSKYTKKGLQSIVAATLQVLDDKILIDRFLPKFSDIDDDSTKPVYIDIRSVNNPKTRGRNMRYRIAASTGWQATVTIGWDSTIIGVDQMNAVVIDAGSLAGIGDGRSIGLGKFAIEDFSVEYCKSL
jgi:hypothetical protein